MLRVLDMKYNIFSTLNPILGRFFHGSGFFRIGSGFLADPDPDSEKRLIRIREKKTGSETLDFLIIILRLAYFLVTPSLELRVCMFSSAVLSPRLMYYDSAEFSPV